MMRAPLRPLHALWLAAPLLAFTTGCGGGTAEPAWAFDPIRLEATEGGVFGIQTWQVYAERWHDRRKDKFYLCSVVVSLQGEPSACPECEVAWEIRPTLVESDCDEALADDPVFLSLRGVGIGALVAAPDAPHPNATSLGFADYGYGWEPHGWAYPEALDLNPPAGTAQWNDEAPFLLWPTYDWPLQ